MKLKHLFRFETGNCLKTKSIPALVKCTALLLLLSTLDPQLSAWAQGTAFTYQGRLNDGASPASGSYDLTFALFSVSSGPGQVGGTLTNAATAVSNGVFSVTFDFGANFPGADRWLEISVRTNSGGGFSTLGPRQKLTPAPYAITAGNVAPGAGLSGTYGSAVTLNNPANQFTGSFAGNGGNLTNVNAATLGGLGSANFWKTAGNAGTAPGANFVGTTDNQPLELKVNGARALRLEPTVNDATHSGLVNVVGGSPVNIVVPGVYGATIAGGGAQNYFGLNDSNSVAADLGVIGGGLANSIQSNGAIATIGGGSHNTIGAANATIGGGVENVIAPAADSATIGGGVGNTVIGFQATVGGGAFNLASNDNATVCGGATNTASGDNATVGGGEGNTSSGGNATVGGGVINRASGDNATVGGGAFIQASGQAATVGGGNANIASGDHATVGGGNDNTASENNATVGGGVNNTASGDTSTVGGGNANIASGLYATSPGGFANTAAGNSSFAAGTHARANHDGTFVWADSLTVDFASTAANQFLIRATGGVGIGTSNPATALHVTDTGDTEISIQNLTPGGHRYTLQSSSTNASATVAASFQIIDRTANISRLLIATNGNVGIGKNNPATTLDVNGTVTATAFNPPSDRNLKENFTPVNPRQVLDRVAAIPISRWNFISDPATPHVGPMAQDFHAAFGLGTDDRHIATVDADGVALAAIQGLNQKLDEKDAKIHELEQRLETLENQFQSRK
jgi:hypothetical protein